MDQSSIPPVQPVQPPVPYCLPLAPSITLTKPVAPLDIDSDSPEPPKAVSVTSDVPSTSPIPSLLTALDVPTVRDPSLPATGKPVAYVDIFVDDFIGLAQEYSNGRRVRRILMHAIDDVFRPLEASDNKHRRQPVSVKKLKQGDCSWSTIKLVLGWIIDTGNMSIHLPPHRLERLSEILASIPITQR